MFLLLWFVVVSGGLFTLLAATDDGFKLGLQRLRDRLLQVRHHHTHSIHWDDCTTSGLKGENGFLDNLSPSKESPVKQFIKLQFGSLVRAVDEVLVCTSGTRACVRTFD